MDERKRKLCFLLEAAVFAVGFLVLFSVMNRIFLYKDLNFYNYHNFMNQPEHTVDILVMGSSHSIDAVDSLRLQDRLEEYGISANAFNMSITGMRLEQMVYRLKEALKTQTPKLLIVETFSLAPMEEEDAEMVRRYALDYMPLTGDKARFIHESIKESRSSFYVPFIKYHTRWSELNAGDFRSLSGKWIRQVSVNEGKRAGEKPDYNGEPDRWFEQGFHRMTQKAAPGEKERRQLEQLLSLAEENGVKVLFLSVPYKVQMGLPNTELIKYNNWLSEKYADDENVMLLDLNRQIGELQWGYHYMQDDGHVNGRGREVVMDCLSRFIHRNLEDRLKDCLGETEGGI